MSESEIGGEAELSQKQTERLKARAKIAALRDAQKPTPEEIAARDMTEVDVVITSEAQPWFGGVPRRNGELCTGPKWEADLMARNGHCTIVPSKPKEV